MPTTRLLVTLAAMASILSGCNQQYRQDNRLSIQQPRDGQRVSAPLTIAWTMRNFDATGLDGRKHAGQGAYAVFLDGPPMPPGKDLRWLSRDDTTCKQDAHCLSAPYLAQLGVYVTDKTSLLVNQLPQIDSQLGAENHTLTVVLLDGQGRRIGEKAWYRNFESKAST